MDDQFDNKAGFHIKYHEDYRVITRKRFFSDGGVAYLRRPLNPIVSKNIFRFFIKKTKKAEIFIGIEKKNPKYLWLLNLNNGFL